MDLSREIGIEFEEWRKLLAELRLRKDFISLIRCYGSSYHILKIARVSLEDEKIDGPERIKLERIAGKMDDDLQKLEEYARVLIEGTAYQ